MVMDTCRWAPGTLCYRGEAMTRLLRPAMPLRVEVCEGHPVRLYHAGRRRVMTRVVASWVRAAAWWAGDADTDPRAGARTYYSVVVDGVVSLEMFCRRGEPPSWSLSRSLD